MSLRIRLLFNFPTYKVLAVSIISIIVGVASISLSVIGLVNQIWGHYVATGIWSGSVIAISGFFGIASAQTRGVCVVKTFMMFSVFSCLASFGVIALSVGGLIYDSKFYLETVYRHPNTRLIHGMLLGTGTLQTILSLICSIICIKHVCCRPKPKHPPASTEEGQIRDEFRRGTDRGSQSSSAPLMSQSKKRRKQKSGGGVYVSGDHPSTSGEHLDSAEHHSKERKRDVKKRNKGLKSSERSNNHPTEGDRQYSSDRERRHSSERERHHSSDRERRHSSDKDRRERSQRASVRQHSPDRYANKPDTNEELVNEGIVEQACAAVVTANRECLANNGESFELISNDMDGLPPYEEVIKDDGIQASFIPISITDADFEGRECISLSSHGNVSPSKEFTEVKQVDAEQEALLCLSAALQSPVISNNSGISDLLSDHIINGCNLSSLSENSIMGSDNVNRLSTELVIQDELDNEEDNENDKQGLSFTEKQALLQKYHTVDPDPQGVMYKEFSRGSDFIKETIVTKPKRSKSFQQTRERDFARGKSVSTRQLSCDTEKNNDCSDEPDSFRSASKSFSRTSSVPGKPPPKPPRTSSLRQHNIESKERPKSATLPYSQFAIMKILDEGKTDTTEIKQPVNTVAKVSEPTREEFLEIKTFDISKIQPPKFRYPRAKLTDETFKEPINTSAEVKSTKPQMEISKQFSGKNEHGTKEHSYNFPKPTYTVAPTPYLPSLNKNKNSKDDDEQNPYTSKNKNRESLNLSLSTSSNVNAMETLKSPLKSPTGYSAVPLKEILLKGQSTSRNIKRPSNEGELSSTSDASSEESSVHEADDIAARADINHEHDRDSQNLSDTEGKPMYSFLL
ncbi:unnamed protein product [Mytilus coruscus]|uniref:Uncharacterized protein n=1 Tax=Mytilus coruscus TaxID=42192 RepID=A0A6J8B5C0_MYTCO|nr:unnamed protein product [Mytilus coruscus]